MVDFLLAMSQTDLTAAFDLAFKVLPLSLLGTIVIILDFVTDI